MPITPMKCPYCEEPAHTHTHVEMLADGHKLVAGFASRSQFVVDNIDRLAVKQDLESAKRELLKAIKYLDDVGLKGSLLWTLLDQQWTALNTLTSAIERKEI